MARKPSPALKKMLKTRKGYRCESYAGGRPGWKPLRIVAEYELELGNVGSYLGMCRAVGLKCDGADLDGDWAPAFDRLADAGKDRLALWLTTKEGAKRYCGDEEPDEYAIPRDVTIATDLGLDGTLFIRRNHG